MPDISLVWDVDNSRGDWQLVGPVLLTGNDLASAALISLFSDRIANPDDVIPDGTDDPRGWWGDLGEDQPIGSRLWLLSRAKQTQETLNNAVDYSREALQWFIDDGVVARIDVFAQWVRTSFLGLQVIFYNQDGTTAAALSYAWAWNQIA
ncbi:phage GP46 family protein [Paraburkholderia xenovorans LB400]|uniref:Bacteriophage protein GP46, Mu-like protein n=1 Tax=Paraburkholderia xenovorans (strain LB400) TaxID=266265 RepID=Q141Q8_PARXL|nr:phage GP46 family protein [Paraburkholderia xenovorans]ABE29931.1 Putative bacteriophage protein GP46, Mu-like protein [Paraburkholderia xenovorans LB400]AIP29575.1 phage GP46 family protein [Paraburkholderia xenovorans LB400]